MKKNGEQLLKKFADTAYPKAVTKVISGIYHVMGYGHSNSIIIEAENSVVLIDTLDTDVRAEQLKKLIAEITEKPVKTIIYTHAHPDHRGGSSVFSDTAPEIIAFKSKKIVLGRTSELNDILNKRTSYQFGYKLSDEEAITQGIGIREGFTIGDGKYAFAPSTTIYDEEKVNRTIDGINIELVKQMIRYLFGYLIVKCFVVVIIIIVVGPIYMHFVVANIGM